MGGTGLGEQYLEVRELRQLLDCFHDRRRVAVDFIDKYGYDEVRTVTGAGTMDIGGEPWLVLFTREGRDEGVAEDGD